MADIAAAVVYLVIGRWLLSSSYSHKTAFFAMLNLWAAYLFFSAMPDPQVRLFIIYVAVVAVHYVALILLHRPGIWYSALLFLAPILYLFILRCVPAHLAHSHQPYNPNFAGLKASSLFPGLSYLTFRISLLGLELRNGIVPRPTFSEYLSFAFFAPTFLVGPINNYSSYRNSLLHASGQSIPGLQAAVRIAVGAAKFIFLAPLLARLGFHAFLLDGYYHPPIDLLIACAAYYLFLYCNFSGFCDIAIAASAMLGISLPENFENPFAARNVKDFWNRWHITLSAYMREVVFSPLSKSLVRAVGPSNANHAIAATILVVFFLVGVWHGIGWNFAIFGFLHAIAVVANHYYTLFLKKRLGKEKFQAYNKNRFVHALAVTATFLYIAATFFTFANDLPTMKTIIASIRWN